MSQIDFGWIFNGFTMNLRFGIGQKSSGIVEPLFWPVPKGDKFIVLAKNGNELPIIKIEKTTDMSAQVYYT